MRSRKALWEALFWALLRCHSVSQGAANQFDMVQGSRQGVENTMPEIELKESWTYHVHACTGLPANLQFARLVVEIFRIWGRQICKFDLNILYRTETHRRCLSLNMAGTKCVGAGRLHRSCRHGTCRSDRRIIIFLASVRNDQTQETFNKPNQGWLWLGSFAGGNLVWRMPRRKKADSVHESGMPCSSLIRSTK